jgi:predicted HTH domain antitoxin
MSVHVTIELPDDAFSVVHTEPEAFVREMRIAAAVKWYEIGLISQAKAAELSGLTRAGFMEALSRFSVSPFQETPEELEREFVCE